MLLVTTNDGSIFRGPTAVSIVKQMRARQWGAVQVKREYKRDVLDRVQQMTGVSPLPRSGYISADSFLATLQRAGLVTLARLKATPKQ